MSTTAPSLISSNISNHLYTRFPLLLFIALWQYTLFWIDTCGNLFQVDLAFADTSVKFHLPPEQCWYTSHVPMYVIYNWTNSSGTVTTTSIYEITQYYAVGDPLP